MKILLSCVIITFLTVACLGSDSQVRRGPGGVEIKTREAKSVSSTFRPADPYYLAIVNPKEEAAPEVEKPQKPVEKKEEQEPLNLRRKRIQLRRNRYSLLQSE